MDFFYILIVFIKDLSHYRKPEKLRFYLFITLFFFFIVMFSYAIYKTYLIM